MIYKTDVVVRGAIVEDRSQIATLLHFEPYVHRHLDWRPPLDWLGYAPYVVAERAGRITAALACPPDTLEVAWIRMFAAAAAIPVKDIWQILWQDARQQLAASAVVTAAAIPLDDWFTELLLESGFQKVHDVVVLLWDGKTNIPPVPCPATIRPMQRTDIAEVAALDAAAFGPLWNNSYELLELAFEQSLLATVAEQDDAIAGYQISTPSPVGAHLARLAVHPAAQRRGIGYALVRDLALHCQRTPGSQLSVNTQHNNAASLALYEKAGFALTGEKYPVLTCAINWDKTSFQE